MARSSTPLPRGGMPPQGPMPRTARMVQRARAPPPDRSRARARRPADFPPGRGWRVDSLAALLAGFGPVASAIKIVVLIGIVMTAVAYISLAERKIAGFIQERFGPNRVGPWGLFQPVADGLKFIFKEEVIPAMAHRPTFILAP